VASGSFPGEGQPAASVGQGNGQQLQQLAELLAALKAQQPQQPGLLGNLLFGRQGIRLIGSLFNGIPPSARSGRLILSLWTTKCCAIATPSKQRYGKLGGGILGQLFGSA
jgi:hypothetical protein